MPAGWFWSGGDPKAYHGLPRRRLWADAFVMRRFPVTNREYLAFLDDLVATGREEEAVRHVPRERAGAQGQEGAMICGRDAAGRFTLVVDADGDAWLPDWPAVQVAWWGAEACALWLAARTGRGWRLPGELMWEEAARGVDGRFYPWGDVLDPSWCCMRESHPGRALPAEVDTYPTDTSPFGVRGMGGGVRDWCADLFDTDGPPVVDHVVICPDIVDVSDRAFRVPRGGTWTGDGRNARCAGRSRVGPWLRNASLGFRVCRVPAPKHVVD